MAAFEVIPQYLQPERPTTINWPLHVCDEVSIPHHQPLYQVYRIRWTHGLERHTYPNIVMSLRICPSARSAHSIQSKRTACMVWRAQPHV